MMSIKRILSMSALAACVAAASPAAAKNVEPGDTSWSVMDSPYTVARDVTIKDRISVSDTVILILNDGCTLTAERGFNVPEGSALYIRTPDGSAGTGKIIATAFGNEAAIGGADGQSAGHIEIDGGSVEASASSDRTETGGAAVGGGRGGDGGDIRIMGGSLTATVSGMSGAAAIGGGYMGEGGSIYISRCKVTAIKSGDHPSDKCGGAGIGGGYKGRGGQIDIDSSTVDVTNVCDGAGIGGGSDASSGNIFIKGGRVTVRAVSYSAAIGGGWRWPASTIEISGGTVDARSNGGAGIGSGGGRGSETSGYFYSGKGNAWVYAKCYVTGAKGVVIGENDFTSGVLFDGDDGKVCGSPTITTSAEVPEGATLTVPSGSTLTIDKGVTITINGKIINHGTIDNHGTIIGEVTNGSGTLGGSGKLNNAGLHFRDGGGRASGDAVLDTDITVTRVLTIAEGASLTLTEGAALTVDDGARLDNMGTLDLRCGELIRRGTITNDGLVIVSAGTDIKSMGMIGSGTVQMELSVYDNEGGYLGSAGASSSGGACAAGFGVAAMIGLAALAVRRGR